MRVSVAVIRSRGRVVLPQEVRAALGVAEGDTVFFVVDGDQVRLTRAPEDFSEYLSLFGNAQPDLSTGEAEV